MPTYYARKAGNINAADVWATAPAGTASAVTFAAGDVLMANSFAITVNVSTNLGATGEVRNDTTGGATAGGSFTLSNGVTLTANVFGGSAASVATVVFSGTIGNSAQIVGNCLGGSASNSFAANNASLGILNISGNCTGGSNGAGVNNGSNGTINITGTCTGGTFNPGARNIGSTGTINITGNCLGSAGSDSSGALNVSTGTLNITGTCTAGIGAPGAINASTGTMLINGVIQASENFGGVGGSNRAQVTLLTGPFLISPTFGVNPIACTAWRWASALNNQTYIEVGTQTLLQKRNLVTPDNATNFPAASDVRNGTAYGIGGVVSGTCVVPNPAQVAAGTPVDNTVGTLTISVPTASEIATAVWGASTKTITGGVVDTLTNAPTVPTPSQIASQVRTELSVELGRVDSAVSSRLASADYTTPPTTSAIATAVEGSLLNEGDGQAVLNAIVGAIGNTNLSEVSLVAAVRADLERTGGKLDSIPTTAAPTAAQNATAVWGAATKEITGGTVTNLTNAPASVTPSDIWSHASRTLTSASGPTAIEIRQELDSNSTQLSAIKAKTDALPASPAATGDIPSANISAIKAKTDLLNTDRLAQVSTVSTTGAQLAAALS